MIYETETESPFFENLLYFDCRFVYLLVIACRFTAKKVTNSGFFKNSRSAVFEETTFCDFSLL